MTSMQLQLPDEVAEAIRGMGKLSSAGITELLREALRGEAIERIKAFAAESEALGVPEMSDAEIQAEIDAVRHERKA